MYMNHVHDNRQGEILGIKPPPQIITTKEGNYVRAEVIGLVVEEVTMRIRMRADLCGERYETDAEALVSLYEESKRGITNAKYILDRLGLFAMA